MKQELIKIDSPEFEGLKESKALKIRKVFEPMAKMLSEFEDAYNSIVSESEITEEVSKRARELRIGIGKIRIATEKERKEQKDESLREGKAIDGVSNILKWAITDKENILREIENHQILLEKKRLNELQKEREIEIAPYLENASEIALHDMEQDVWAAYLYAKKKHFKDKRKAEKDAEAKRKKDEREFKAEQKRVREENEKLRADNERQEKEAEAEREKQKVLEDKRIAIENERIEKEQEAERSRLRAEKEKQRVHDAEIQKERDRVAEIEKLAKEKADKLEAEIKEREEADAKRIKEEQDNIQAELNKGDTAKVKDLISDLANLRSKYNFKSAKNKKMNADVSNLLNKIISFIEK